MPQEGKDLGMNAETGGANVPQNTCVILARLPPAERSSTKGFPPTQFACARFDANGDGTDRAVSGTPARRRPRQGGGCFAGGTIAWGREGEDAARRQSGDLGAGTPAGSISSGLPPSTGRSFLWPRLL